MIIKPIKIPRLARMEGVQRSIAFSQPVASVYSSSPPIHSRKNSPAAILPRLPTMTKITRRIVQITFRTFSKTDFISVTSFALIVAKPIYKCKCAILNFTHYIYLISQKI